MSILQLDSSKEFKLLNKLSILFLFCIIFMPKIFLYDVSQGQIGIRTEHLLLILFCINLFYSGRGFKEFFLVPSYLFFAIWLVVASLSSWYFYNASLDIFVLLKICENYLYIVIAFFLLKEVKVILVFSKLGIIINFLAATLQYFDILGGVYNSRFYEAGHSWLDRPWGLYGGPWELSFLMSCLGLILVAHERFGLSNIVLHLMVLWMVLISGTRSVIFAHVVVMLFLFLQSGFSGSGRPWVRLLLSSVVLMGTVTFIFFDPNLYSRVVSIFHIFGGLFSFDLEVTSIAIRVSLLSSMMEHFLTSPFTFLFGVGLTHMNYYESAIFRVIFSVGILGMPIVFWLLAVNLRPHLLLFFGLVGVGIDIWYGGRIFFLSCLVIFSWAMRNDRMKYLDSR